MLFYLVILFAAAFLLLLLSYFMQQRANQDAMDDLQQTSDSAVQSLENLLQEKDEPAGAGGRAGGQVDAQEQLDSAQDSSGRPQEQLDASPTPDPGPGLVLAHPRGRVRGRYTPGRELMADGGAPPRQTP